MSWEIYIIVFFTASTKFFVSPFLGVNGLGMSVIDTFLTVSLGGVFGATVFYTAGNKLINFSQKRRLKKLQKLKIAGKPLPKIMTKTNKIIIKTKHIFGIWGLALLTVVILSIPIGSIICAKFYRHKKSTLFIIFFFILVMSLILSLIANSFPSVGK